MEARRRWCAHWDAHVASRHTCVADLRAKLEQAERERDEESDRVTVCHKNLAAAQAREAELQNSLRHALIFQDMQRTAEKLLRAPGSTDALEAFAVKCIERSHRFKYDDSKAVVREVLKGEG